MKRLPTIITSSVIRSSHQGESHGGVYIVDLETGSFDQVIDWNDGTIDWEGRGGERGLRGVVPYNGRIYLASDDAIYAFDQNFSIIKSFPNRYLKHTHEICLSGDSLFVTSTGFDSILQFDLVKEIYAGGYCLRGRKPKNIYRDIKNRIAQLLRLKTSQVANLSRFDSGRLKTFLITRLTLFDPNSEDGPLPGDTFHLNNVQTYDGILFLSGSYTYGFYYIKNNSLKKIAPLPIRTHNPQLYNSGILFNWTPEKKVAYQNMKGEIQVTFPIKRYPEAELLNSDLPKDHATQSFGRGLLATRDGLIIGGSSPATISVYEFGYPEAVKTVNFTMDVRNSIHGMALWE